MTVSSVTRVLSCVPRQHTTFEDKMNWLYRTHKRYSPDLIVTPQEYFGGVVMMPDRPAFSRNELLPPLQQFCRDQDCGLVVGLLLRDHALSRNREVIWFIDRDGTFKGQIAKFALPRYDQAVSGGSGNVIPETDFTKRLVVFEVSGLVVSAIFCWEVFSDILWTGLGLLKPDVVFSLLKFGPNAWPVVKRVRGVDTVVGFEYGHRSDEGHFWIERLRVASKWQVKCPVISSTNSWNLRPRSIPICGTICEIPGQAKDTLRYPSKDDTEVPELIQVDEINPGAIRAALRHKMVYKKVVGEWPPFSLIEYTMMLKIRRIEDRILAGRGEFQRRRSVPTFNLIEE